MLPRTKGKEIIDCDLSDLQSISDDPNFAKSECFVGGRLYK